MDKIYGPEDIEQLLLNKRFDDLYEEERDYVLKHIEDRTEYEQMRSMLLSLEDETPLPPPPASLRAQLMDQHTRKHRGMGFNVWLNSLWTAILPREAWASPALQLTGVGLVVIAMFGLFRLGTSPTEDMAYEPNLEQRSIAEGEPLEEDSKAQVSPLEHSDSESQAQLEQELDLKGSDLEDLSEIEVVLREDAKPTYDLSPLSDYYDEDEAAFNDDMLTMESELTRSEEVVEGNLDLEGEQSTSSEVGRADDMMADQYLEYDIEEISPPTSAELSQVTVTSHKQRARRTKVEAPIPTIPSILLSALYTAE